MNVPTTLRYTSTHEWIRDDADGTWTVATHYVKYEIPFPARYENGHWRFGLPAGVKANLRLPMGQYLASKCAKKP